MIAALDVELCDCFLDYGEASAEMFLLLTFVAFGASAHLDRLPGGGRTDAGLRGARAGPAHGGADPGAGGWAGVEPRSRRLIAWLGPRGLSSLLLALLPVFAGVEGPCGCSRSPASWCCSRWWSTAAASRSSSAATRSAARPPAPARPAGGAGARRARRPGRAPRRSAAASGEDHHPGVSRPAGARGAGDRAGRADRAELSRRSAAIARDAIRMPPDDAVRLARERRLDPTRHWSSTVPERTKPQAPGWRESFVRQDGRRPGPWSAAGRPGTRPASR